MSIIIILAIRLYPERFLLIAGKIENLRERLSKELNERKMSKIV